MISIENIFNQKYFMPKQSELSLYKWRFHLLSEQGKVMVQESRPWVLEYLIIMKDQCMSWPRGCPTAYGFHAPVGHTSCEIPNSYNRCIYIYKIIIMIIEGQ